MRAQQLARPQVLSNSILRNSLCETPIWLDNIPKKWKNTWYLLLDTNMISKHQKLQRKNMTKEANKNAEEI